MAVEETVWGEVDGRTITFPMVVPEINAATLMFTVPYGAAEALLPDGRFEVLEVAPGVAQLVIALCDYVRNPWGDYNEINLGFLARPKGAPDSEMGSFMYRMPVDQEFTCAAGNQVMGLPKTVEQIEFRYTDETVQVHLVFDGQPTLQVTFPRVPGVGEPDAVRSESYAYLDGVPFSTTLEMEMGTGIIDPDDVVLTLGEGVVADELRSLGLPTVPDLATWGEGLRGVFLLPRPLPAA
jgi:hypothetical protein